MGQSPISLSSTYHQDTWLNKYFPFENDLKENTVRHKDK